MDKIADVIQEMIRTGGPLASRAMELWFYVRALDALSSVLLGVIIVGGLLLGLRLVLNYCRWFFREDRN